VLRPGILGRYRPNRSTDKRSGPREVQFLSRVGSATSFAAEASLWIAGAAIVVGAAGAHWSMPSVPSVDLGGLIAESSPRGSASPVASAAASATPATVVDRFQSFWAGWGSQYVISYVGTQSTTSGTTTTASTIDGTISSSGSDCSFATGATQGGQRGSLDTILVGADKYTRSNGGTWKKTARAATDTCTVPPLLKSRAFIYKGVETKNGAQLHRFEVADPAQLSAEWQAYAGLSNVKDNLIYWVNLDGTPAAFQLTGSNDATSGGKQSHVVFTTDYTITKLSGVTITAPKA
jgi:hypothetical protein